MCKQQLVLQDTTPKTTYLLLGERDKQDNRELHEVATLTEESGKREAAAGRVLLLHISVSMTSHSAGLNLTTGVHPFQSPLFDPYSVKDLKIHPE